MMACWKQNDFNDKSCAEEIRAFYDCVAKAEVMKITFMFLKSSSREGGETLGPFFVSQRNSVLWTIWFVLWEIQCDVHRVHSPFCLNLEFQ